MITAVTVYLMLEQSQALTSCPSIYYIYYTGLILARYSINNLSILLIMLLGNEGLFPILNCIHFAVSIDFFRIFKVFEALFKFIAENHLFL